MQKLVNRGEKNILSIKKNVKRDLEISATCLGVDKPVNGPMFNALLAVQAGKSARILVNTFHQLKNYCKDPKVEPDLKMWVESFVESFNLEMKKRGEKK